MSHNRRKHGIASVLGDHPAGRREQIGLPQECEDLLAGTSVCVRWVGKHKIDRHAGFGEPLERIERVQAKNFASSGASFATGKLVPNGNTERSQVPRDQGDASRVILNKYRAACTTAERLDAHGA